MSSKKTTNSFNHEVLKKAYTRLNLSSSNRAIFSKLLGFLIRNEYPFPYSAVSMSELTALHKRTIFRALNELERCRLIERIGMGKNRKFKRGTILSKILTTVTNRLKHELSKTSTTVTLCHSNLTNRDMVSYRKTYSSLKHKERQEFFYDSKTLSGYQEYAGRINSDKKLGLLLKDAKIMTLEDWINSTKPKNQLQ